MYSNLINPNQKREPKLTDKKAEMIKMIKFEQIWLKFKNGLNIKQSVDEGQIWSETKHLTKNHLKSD